MIRLSSWAACNPQPFYATVKFRADLLDRRDRMVDQMVQAARSGKQNGQDMAEAVAFFHCSSPERSRQALDSALKRLVDPGLGVGGWPTRSSRPE
jgi:hypothetical protein